MAGRIARMFEKVGLVELEKDPNLDELLGQKTPVVSEPVPSIPVIVEEGEVAEGVAFESIYSKRAVGKSPFTVEQFQKLIEGIKQLDQATRVTVVQSFDAADDKWTIQDVISDAHAKAQALREESANIRALTEQKIAQQKQDIDKMTKDQEALSADLREQINQLQQKLLDSTNQTSADIAKQHALIIAAGETASREERRLNQQADTLISLVQPFAPTV